MTPCGRCALMRSMTADEECAHQVETHTNHITRSTALESPELVRTELATHYKDFRTFMEEDFERMKRDEPSVYEKWKQQLELVGQLYAGTMLMVSI